MNQYIADALKVDLARVMIELCKNLIDPQDFLQILTDPPQDDEDIMDYIDRDDAYTLQIHLRIARSLTHGLTPDHLHALKTAMAQLWVECDTCGGIILYTCTCEA